MPMKAIRVTVNGKVILTAGADDLSVLNGIINIFPKAKKPSETNMYYSVSGLSESGIHKSWVDFGAVKVGDSITFEVVETDLVNKPVSFTDGKGNKL
jgi:hypothetical protein